MNNKINNNYLILKYKEILEEWHYEKNGDKKPEDFKVSSADKVWWQCNKGHEWEIAIKNRALGSGCPYCSGRRVSEDNSLVVLFPDLAKEWNYEKNDGLKPEDVSYGSQKKVWWMCPLGHEWKSTVKNRTRGGTGCPNCYPKTSLPEQIIYYYLKDVFFDSINRYVHPLLKNGAEIDIFIPKLNLGIEYDGAYYHENQTLKDENKNFVLTHQSDMYLIRVRDQILPSINMFNADLIEYKPNQDNEFLNRIIVKILEKIMNRYKLKEEELSKIRTIINNIDIKKDEFKFLEFIYHKIEKESITQTHPEILKLWNYDKNGILEPSGFKSGSAKKVWWKCEKNHEWQAGIRKICNGQRCPYCSNKKINNENNLLMNFPLIAKEWNYNKNQKSPSEYSSGSSERVWWRCVNGHEWVNSIKNRTRKKQGCRKCRNQKLF